MASNTDAIMALAVAHLSMVAMLAEKGLITTAEHDRALEKFSRGLKNASPEVLDLIRMLMIEEVENKGGQP